MKKHIIQSISFAIWKADYPALSFNDWTEYPDKVKETYCVRAKAAVREYKKLLKANGLEIVLLKR